MLLNGRSVLGDHPDRLRQRVGMVFQQFNLFPYMSVRRNLALALRRIRRLSADEAVAVARRHLDRVGLAAKAEARPAQLSGGQQQRVAIARALALQPQVMLFDEVTSALDPELVEGVLSLMADLSADGMTMVVTHEMAFAREVTDLVAFMDRGVVLEAGAPEAVFESAEHPRLRRFLSQVV